MLLVCLWALTLSSGPSQVGLGPPSWLHFVFITSSKALAPRCLGLGPPHMNLGVPGWVHGNAYIEPRHSGARQRLTTECPSEHQRSRYQFLECPCG